MLKMIFKVKYIFATAFFLLIISITASAQEKKYNQISAELSGGVHAPISPKDGISRIDYVGWKQFQLSGRYMFNEYWGLKGHYGFNHFENSNYNDLGIIFNRLGLEGVANVGKLININYRIREYVGLLFHTGIGATMATTSSNEANDKIGNIIVGLTGLVKLNKSLALFGDVSYIANISQNYGFNGVKLTETLNSNNGGAVNINIGLMIYLGKHTYHSDWY